MLSETCILLQQDRVTAGLDSGGIDRKMLSRNATKI